MRVLFTTKGNGWDAPMDARFGRMEMMAIYDETNDTFTYVENSEVNDMGHGAGLQTAKKALDYNPDVIITGNGAGEKALQVLQKSTVKMYVGAGDMSVKEAYDAFKQDKLKQQF